MDQKISCVEKSLKRFSFFHNRFTRTPAAFIYVFICVSSSVGRSFVSLSPLCIIRDTTVVYWTLLGAIDQRSHWLASSQYKTVAEPRAFILLDKLFFSCRVTFGNWAACSWNISVTQHTNHSFSSVVRKQTLTPKRKSVPRRRFENWIRIGQSLW